MAVFEIVLGVEHRLLEVDDVGKHLVAVDRIFIGGKYVQIAVAEDAGPDAPLENCVVDLVQGAVAGLLVEQSLNLEDPTSRDDVALGPPGGVDDADPNQA